MKALRRRRNHTDYMAVREAAVGPMLIAPILFLFMATAASRLSVTGILLSIAIGLFGMYSLVLGIRTLALLELFPNTDIATSESTMHNVVEERVKMVKEPNKAPEDIVANAPNPQH